jgi:hypothetical protein
MLDNANKGSLEECNLLERKEIYWYFGGMYYHRFQGLGVRKRSSVQNSACLVSSLTWRWWFLRTPIYFYLLSQKTTVFIVTAVRISNLAKCSWAHILVFYNRSPYSPHSRTRLGFKIKLCRQYTIHVLSTGVVSLSWRINGNIHFAWSPSFPTLYNVFSTKTAEDQVIFLVCRFDMRLGRHYGRKSKSTSMLTCAGGQSTARAVGTNWEAMT